MVKSISASSFLRLSPRAVLPVLYLLAIIPMPWLLNSCSAEVVPVEAATVDTGAVRTLIEIHREDATKAESWRFIRSLDIFLFEEGGTMLLDTYTRESSPSGERVGIMSGSGRKRAVIIANSDLRKESREIGCYDDLKALESEYSKDNPEYPILCGESMITAGEGGTVILRPLLALIEITGISAPIGMGQVKAYLINASNRCRFLSDGPGYPSEFINFGSLKEYDLQKMSCPRMAYTYLGDGVVADGRRSFRGCCLYCYPNNSEQESAGSPFTTLIVEGQLGGITKRYEIAVNRPGAGYTDGVPGVSRNTRYALELEIGG